MKNKKYDKIIFAAGCFWGVEYVFTRFPGVVLTKVGYTGGRTKNPTYEMVCFGKTGHAEALYIEFDANEISFSRLLDVFFKSHDPTTLNKQGPDIGSQYRSAIFYYNEEQKIEAKNALEKHQNIVGRKIVTEILPAKEFFPAEEYHQKYYDKKGQMPYCHIVPKI